MHIFFHDFGQRLKNTNTKSKQCMKIFSQNIQSSGPTLHEVNNYLSNQHSRILRSYRLSVIDDRLELRQFYLFFLPFHLLICIIVNQSNQIKIINCTFDLILITCSVLNNQTLIDFQKENMSPYQKYII